MKLHQRPFGVYDDSPKFIVYTNLKLIPANMFSALRRLYLYCMNELAETPLEVSSILCINKETMQWKILIPRQIVTGVSVNATFDLFVDLVDGTFYNHIPFGWAHVGSSHSHHRMGAFFSGTDDANELPFPGLHFVIGNLDNFNNYRSIVSIVCADHVRRYTHLEKIVDTTNDDTTFHPNVLNQINLPKVKNKEYKDYLTQTFNYIQTMISNRPELIEPTEDFSYDISAIIQDLMDVDIVENIIIDESDSEVNDPFYYKE